MLNLTTDSSQIASQFDLDPLRDLLFSAIRLDSHPWVAPIIATDSSGSDPVLLVRQQEQGNVLSAGIPADRIKFYAPWVTIDPRPVADIEVAPTLKDLVSELAGGEKVELAPDIVYSHFLSLSEQLEVTVSSSPKIPVSVYEVHGEEVLNRFAQWRQSAVPVANQLIEGVEHLTGLEKEIDGTGADSRFEGIRRICRERALDSLLVTAPPNFSELTGIAAVEGTAVLWSGESERLFIITPRTLPAPQKLEQVGTYESGSAAVVALSRGGLRIGVEEEFIGVGAAQDLQNHGATLIGVQTDLAHWRDVRDCEDLPFQVIAARATVHAIEGALEWAASELARGRAFREIDINECYLAQLKEFTRENDIPFDIEPYFTNLHSSNRMLFPGPPTEFPINEETTCIQLDAGVSVKIDGVIVATSDMARSLPRTESAIEAYEFFFDVVREGIIGQLKPGVICEDVHEGTLDYLAPHLDRMIEIGMLGADTPFNEIYRGRNVGHLMGKQESFANELRPGYKHVLEVGSFGAAEIPWRYDNAAIGTEDLWYIGRDRTYVLSQK